MGKKYTTDEIEVGGHMLDASMMGSLNTIVSAGSHTLAGYLTTYIDTTYSVGNGGLTEINFTSALNTKLAGIATGANNYVLPFTNNSANWNTAYGWGNHAGLYAAASHSHAQYIVEGGTSFSGVYPMVVRVGATSYYSDQDITFTGASSQLYVGGSIRTPIIYDSDNTAYQLDLTGTSRATRIQADYIGAGTGAYTSGSYRLNMGGNIRMNNNGIDYTSQLHFNSNVRFYQDSNDSYLNFKYGDATTGGIKFLNGGGTVKGYVFANAESFGLLDATGNWAVKTAVGAAPLTLSSNSNPEFLVYDSYTYSPGSSRAPIFYDSNNTGFYLNPASTSLMNSIVFTGNSTPIVSKYSGKKSWVQHITDNAYIFAPSTAIDGTLWDWPNQIKLSADGTVTAKNFILSSDERLKTKIADLSCDNIDVNWKSFEMTSSEGEYRTGVIAQELEQKHPEFVNTDDKGFKAVKYIDLLIAKIAELEARLEKLEK